MSTSWQKREYKINLRFYKTQHDFVSKYTRWNVYPLGYTVRSWCKILPCFVLELVAEYTCTVLLCFSFFPKSIQRAKIHLLTRDFYFIQPKSFFLNNFILKLTVHVYSATKWSSILHHSRTYIHSVVFNSPG